MCSFESIFAILNVSAADTTHSTVYAAKIHQKSNFVPEQNVTMYFLKYNNYNSGYTELQVIQLFVLVISAFANKIARLTVEDHSFE